ncbi:Chloroperoxidase [Mycena vulgaris]|nr:Chloroperoxidase [Mycena vulgaris]
MHLTSSILIIAAVVTDTLAFGVPLWEQHQWIAPKATDSRSPCPGLNTLANHGYLPRTGRNISIPMILDAALDVYHLQADTILSAAKFGLLSGSAHTTLDLEALKLHNLLETDASLSRSDFDVGDNLHFNETIFTTLANSNPGVDYYNVTSAAQVQDARLADSIAINPNVTNTAKEFLFRAGTAGLYLSVMGNPLTGVAPKKFVQIFFREERLPIAEGWKRSEPMITTGIMSAIVESVVKLSKGFPTQACEPLVFGPGVVL